MIRNEVSRGEGSSQAVAGPAALGLPKREAYLGTLCSEVPRRKAILMHDTGSPGPCLSRSWDKGLETLVRNLPHSIHFPFLHLSY